MRDMAPGSPMVLHVVPTALARGAQREARALADGLALRSGRRHLVVSLFAGVEQVTMDVALDHRSRHRSAAEGFEPLLVAKVRRLLAASDPVAVVAHGGDALKYLIPAMAGRHRPAVYYATGTFARADRRWQVMLWRALMGRADVVAAEGEEVMAECRELLGVPPARLVLAPNGRDPEVFQPRPADQADDDRREPTVLFVGALNSGKAPDRFLDMVSELHRRGQPLRAAVCGDGPMRDAMEEQARRLGVEMLGPVDDVAAVLRQGDVLVFPSRPTGEGMPGVLIEAGLSALPVVATDVPGASAIVEDGTTGLLVPVDDERSLADAVASLLADPQRRRAMGAAARRRCLERFSMQVVLRTWSSFLDPLVAGRLRKPSGPDGPGTLPGPAA